MSESIRILLVDDDEVDREAMVRAFEKEGIKNPIVLADDGVHALEILRGTPTTPPLTRPYIILLDLNMPRMNGLEFLEVLRDDPSLATSLVFVLTTSNDEADKLAAYAHNIAGFITKQKAAEDFSVLSKMLSVYWRLIELPT
ncbi:MAG: response regulator [Burkholderiaceae bacterium]